MDTVSRPPSTERRAARRAAVVLALALALGGCSDRAPGRGGALAAEDRLPEAFGQVPEFALTERSGRTVTREDLLGRPAVVDFFFTNCTGPCPVLTANMRKLQDELAGTRVRLVSISVDPGHDTPEVLSEFADALGADPERWWFLTGEETKVFELVRGGFLMAVERAEEGQAPPGQEVTHATRFVVVDAEGAMRGAFEGQDPEGVAAAAQLARRLDDPR